MSVAVSLAELVKVPGTSELWPEEFRALVAKLEDVPGDNNQWLVLADWLKEHEETAMEAACRWVPGTQFVFVQKYSSGNGWFFRGLPKCIEGEPLPEGDTSTLAGAIAVLAERLRRVREAVA